MKIYSDRKDAAEQLIEALSKYKDQKDAVILVHNYQRPEIYEIADAIGDSLGLAKAAVKTKAKTIVFCGVDFMAESAKILNPKKTVLIPSKQSICPMAAMVTPSQIKEMKKKHPKAIVVSYVNTTAEVKAESDICCTSANAVKIVNSLKEKEVIFTPDKNLAAYTQTKTDKKIFISKAWAWDLRMAVDQALDQLERLIFKEKKTTRDRLKKNILKIKTTLRR